jgi:hypothetical protein
MCIYASDLYDEKDMFDYPIFPGLLKSGSDEPLTHFKSFILRNSGNDYDQTYFRDGMLQTLVSHLGFDTQAYRPAIVFINGEYWGIYNIREKYDDWYIITHYDTEMDETVILEDRDVKVKVGMVEDRTDFLDIIRFIEKKVDSGTINDPGVYEYINTQINTDNFINYFASQIFFLNTDWPQNNIGFWHLRKDIYTANTEHANDGRWRCMMFDVDLSFSLWGQEVDHNSFGHAEDNNKLFELIIKNDKFKYSFINTFADLINSTFKSEWVIKKIKNTQEVLEPEMFEHLKRWNLMGNSLEQWDKNVQEMIEFAHYRPMFQIQHINEFFSLNGTAEINLIADSQKGYIRINSLELKEGEPGIEDPSNWKGMYFKGVPINVTAIPYTGYEFLGWTELENNDESIIITLEDNLTLTAVFTDLSY